MLYDNGWYELKTKDGFALYRADDTLVADKLASCYVGNNGLYGLKTKDGYIHYFYENGKPLFE